MLLTALVGVVFGGTLRHDFVNYDDPEYVVNNPWVIRGLTFKGVLWAFTHSYSSNWHPLTWISHMLDCQWFDLNPAGHHYTSVALHAVTVILLFVLLKQMTGSLGKSAWVAAIFAIHPLRVESVAWVAERKDVLSGLFFMLTLIAYLRYARDPARSWRRYGVVALCFAAGLMSKPMLVTVPVVLLLLDYWPLQRFPAPNAPDRFSAFGTLVREKLPLIVMSLASIAITIISQDSAIQAMAHVAFPVRITNGMVAIAIYLRQMVWPTGLAVLYPHTEVMPPVWQLATALLLIGGMSLAALALRKRFPWLVTGWFWYLAMLTPVIGILQVGVQSHADRYTYLPLIGVSILIASAAGELARRLPAARSVFAGTGIVTVIVLAVCAHRQTAFWKDSESLWTRTLALTENNYVAHGNIGLAILKKGRTDEAILHFEKALKIRPAYLDAADNLGYALLVGRRVDESVVYLRNLAALNPKSSATHVLLGHALFDKGLLDETIVHARKAIELKPDLAQANYLLAQAFFQKGQIDESLKQGLHALEALPNVGMLQYIVGTAFCMKGRVADAIPHFEEAVRLEPKLVHIRNNLAWILATSPEESLRNGTRAVGLIEEANRATRASDANVLSTLAAAYAETGRFSEAVATAQSAVQKTNPQRESKALRQREEQLRTYEADKPFRDMSLAHGK